MTTTGSGPAGLRRCRSRQGPGDRCPRGGGFRWARTYRSDALAAIHEAASDLHDAGVMDKRALREFDERCLSPVRPMTAAEIRALRTRERVSQAVFARHLNVTTGPISQ